MAAYLLHYLYLGCRCPRISIDLRKCHQLYMSCIFWIKYDFLFCLGAWEYSTCYRTAPVLTVYTHIELIFSDTAIVTSILTRQIIKSTYLPLISQVYYYLMWMDRVPPLRSSIDIKSA